MEVVDDSNGIGLPSVGIDLLLGAREKVVLVEEADMMNLIEEDLSQGISHRLVDIAAMMITEDVMPVHGLEVPLRRDIRVLHVVPMKLLKLPFSSKMIPIGTSLLVALLIVGDIFVMWRMCLRIDGSVLTPSLSRRELQYRI